MSKIHNDSSKVHGESWIHYEPQKIRHFSEKLSKILSSSVQHPENVENFHPGKNKEDQKGRMQSHSPSETELGPAAIKSKSYTRHKKRSIEAKLELQRAFFTIKTNIERSEIARNPN
ncbi:hypothetical protein AYI70_g4190 [Smittium culicis]|uniref:Uncharacterized protein n=1 Tax=Smittium culicis TaxID=133412 RepID=A0A1R1Y081_9FUNG|nr:hypothetical protein AYI70_g4190 [Smittium culicis]